MNTSYEKVMSRAIRNEFRGVVAVRKLAIIILAVVLPVLVLAGNSATEGGLR